MKAQFPKRDDRGPVEQAARPGDRASEGAVAGSGEGQIAAGADGRAGPGRGSKDIAVPRTKAPAVGTERTNVDGELGMAGYIRVLPFVRLRGIRLHALTQTQTIEYILNELDSGRGGQVATPNLDHLRRVWKNPSLIDLYMGADLVVADGMPLVWASKLRGTPLPERVAGSDLIVTLTAAAADRRRSVFLLGGSPGTASAAADVLKQRYPTIEMAGTYYPELGFENSQEELARLRKTVVDARPDIVYVALGSPKQERIIRDLRPHLPGTWFLGIGISFSFVCGEIRRAPRWMQKAGMEWVHRLCQEPKRLFKRYLVHGLPFAGVLLGGSAMVGLLRLRRRERQKSVTHLSQMFYTWQKVRDAGPDGATSSGAEAPAREESPPGQGQAASSSPEAAGVPPAVGLAASAWIETPGRSTPPTALARLRGVVLLSGGVRPTRLVSLLGRSILDLPVAAETTLLEHWCNLVTGLARQWQIPRLKIQILVNRAAPTPPVPARNGRIVLELQHDPRDFRGVGGLLRDLSTQWDEDDLLLVANGAQVVLQPLEQVVSVLAGRPADLVIGTNPDGAPAGVMLVRSGALRSIPDSGFIDLKEQALPLLAQRHSVRVAPSPRAISMPIRELPDYIAALRAFHKAGQSGPAPAGIFAEDWQPCFRLVESGAWVGDGAQVHDSVVLRGGRVAGGATVARCVVGQGGAVEAGEQAVDRVVVPEFQARLVPRRGAAR